MEKQQAKKYINELKNEYIENHIKLQHRELLIEEINTEKRDVKGYHGREIFELLQNADDAYQKSINENRKPDCDLIVTICYKDNMLSVKNIGTCFDEEGIKAIVQGNNSPKKGNYIGNKGTGFRSILNWAEDVYIYSGIFNVHFSKEIANSVFESIKNEAQIQKQLRKEPNLYVPMLAVPEYVADAENIDDTTEIKIKINPDNINDEYSVDKQIEDIDLKILLFLPNIKEIKIITPNKEITYKREIENDGMDIYSLSKIVDDREDNEKYYLFSKQIIPNDIEETEENKGKKIGLSIAVPVEIDNFHADHLYSYFPLLDTQAPFNCLFHATYILGDHRNTINSNAENKSIVKHQIDYFVEVLNILVANRKFDLAYKVMRPMNLSWSPFGFNMPFSKFKLEDYFFKLILKQKLFLTVNDECISFDEGLKLINGGFLDLFKGEAFNKLLKTQNDEVLFFIKRIALMYGYKVEYKENELLEAINTITEQWNIEEQVSTFIWWNGITRSSLPKLLKTENGNWLEYKDECYFLVGDFDSITLPNWVKIPAIAREYQEELFRQSEKTQKIIDIRKKDKEPQISRIISNETYDIYPTLNFKYRDKSNIITTLNSSVKTYEQAIEFVKWLWTNYKDDESWTPAGKAGDKEIYYNFPNSSDHNVIHADKLFFGSDFGNPLAEILFSTGYEKMISLNEFSISSEEINNFIFFISKFGVKKYPPILNQSIPQYIPSLKKYEKNIKTISHYAKIDDYLFSWIENLDQLLLTLKMEQIIEWLIKDSNLRNHLCNKLESSNSKIIYHSTYKTKNYKYGPFDNFILETFNNTQWIKFENEKYSPNQVLSWENSTNLKFLKYIPVLTIDIIKKISCSINKSVAVVEDVFRLFSFPKTILELSSDEFYGMMLRIQDNDINNNHEIPTIYKRIYGLIDKNKEIYFESSNNKSKFFNDGKLLVKHNNQLKLEFANKSYLPSIKIVDKRSIPIIDKSIRTGNQIFKDLFGCKEYNSEYTILKYNIAFINKEFQEYFNEYKKYASAYVNDINSSGYSNIANNLPALSITLVNDIEIVEKKNNVKIMDEYALARESQTKWYITVFESTFDYNKISQLVETIFDNIANTPGYDSSKLGELFRAKNKVDKDFLILKDFGTLCVINEKDYQNEIKNNFIDTVKRICPDYNIESINIDFNAFQADSSIKAIISLFKDINIDIDDFIANGFFYNIDLIPYYKKQLNNYIRQELPNYRNYQYTLAVENEQLQADFINKTRSFELFEIDNYDNSINFDYKEKIISKFGTWNNDINTLNAFEEYDKNYKAMNSEGLYKDEISVDNSAQTMIYFAKVDEFNQWKSAKAEKLEMGKNEKTDIYSKYDNVVPTIQEIVYTEAILTNDTTESNYDGVYTLTEERNRNKRKKEAGNKAEKLIYNLLVSKYGKENVHPVSEAFVAMDILSPGQARSGRYDISYTDDKEYFVEVKKGNNNSFYITPSELSFARTHPEQYKLFLVYNLEKDIPDYVELPMRFWEDSRYRQKEIIESIKIEF